MQHTLHWGELNRRPLRPTFWQRHPALLTATTCFCIGAAYTAAVLAVM